MKPIESTDYPTSGKAPQSDSMFGLDALWPGKGHIVAEWAFLKMPVHSNI